MCKNQGIYFISPIFSSLKSLPFSHPMKILSQCGLEGADLHDYGFSSRFFFTPGYICWHQILLLVWLGFPFPIYEESSFLLKVVMSSSLLGKICNFRHLLGYNDFSVFFSVIKKENKTKGHMIYFVLCALIVGLEISFM